MKKLIIFFSLFIVFGNCSGMSHVQNFLAKRNIWGFEQAVDAIAPQVGIMYIADDLDFKQTALNLIHAAKSPDIWGIIVIIDNNGGRTTQFSMLHDIIKKITPIKPVICLVTAALSGGYMVASATDYIIATRLAAIGSIGVLMEISRFQDPVMNQNGIKTKYTVDIFKAGKFKDLYDSHSQELSEEERAYIQDSIDRTYEEFKKMMVENRNLKLEDSEQWAEAQSFIAPEALELGLIDEIGTMFEAEAKIIELIRAKNPIESFKNKVSPFFYDEKNVGSKQ